MLRRAPVRPVWEFSLINGLKHHHSLRATWLKGACSACTSAWAFVYLFNDQGLTTTTDHHLSQCVLEAALHLRRCAFCLFE